MRRALRASLVMAAALASACGGPGVDPGDSAPGGGAAAADRPEESRGVVRVVGSAPVDVHVILEREDGSAVRVTGPLRDEIRRLSGALVRVEGPLEPSDMPVAKRQVRATDYEILSINGEPVIQGVVVGKTGGWTVLRTREGEDVYLASAPDAIRTGQRVWVQGPRSVVVQSYGVMGEGQVGGTK